MPEQARASLGMMPLAAQVTQTQAVLGGEA